MWDLNTIVRMNDEAQRRADAIREHEARERQSREQEFIDEVVALGLACPVNEEADQDQAA
jgi:hypothetical protein